MRRVALAGAAAALVFGLVGVVSITAASQAAEPSLDSLSYSSEVG